MPALTPPEIQHRHSALLDLIGAAPDAQALFATVSARLRRLVPFDAAVWRATDPDTGLVTAPIRVENLQEGQCGTYWRLELFEERVNRFTDLARSPVPAAALRESTGDAPDHSSVYRHFMRPHGYGDELRVVLRAGGRPHGHISLLRESGRPAFTPAETLLAAGLSVPLAKRLRRTHTAPAGGTDTDGDTGPGLLVFDPSGALLSVNDEARHHLATLPTGPSTDTSWGLRLPEWIHSTAAHAQAVAEQRGTGGTRIRTRTRSGGWLVCHASCLRSPEGRRGGSAVVIERAKASEIAPLLLEAYELSHRELEITGFLSRGLPTAEIATRLYLSPHTVRDHIKAVLAKTGASSRGELVGKLFAEHYAPLAEEGTVRVLEE
ncbi:response regulator transcription factor [Nocardiopsis sp. JB363]|uniref:response regulator transcription factor n=1 Tax=Nocardiopsis sp. JB363 TaxID=1434837 RepID=UPI00097A455D|nr:helix-turn-helix transcriptional regulator [Nocardiopsis sp. JB363]SIO88823.1 hypothetical protein BQ8420_20070 [Nocardiopsis sp. JB363]